MTSQLLIEMPAEGAARLLTLSLLEQVSSALGDPRHGARYVDTYRAAVRRLRACLTLYADALGDSVPRKARRRLRQLMDAAERMHRADVQLAWVGRHLPQHEHRENSVPLGDHVGTAIWLEERLRRRHERARRALARVQGNSRPLRRIAKRLSVYTTAVQLDTLVTPRSFAQMTSDQLLVNADALGAAIRMALGPGSHGQLRRARRAAEHLGYLLDPLRAYADVEELITHLTGLRAALEHLDEVTIVGRAIVRGGRRVAALHAGETLRAAIWPPPEVAPTVPPAAMNGRAPASPAELQRGLVVFAEFLHDEAERAFAALSLAWQEGGADAFVERITAIAAELQA